jgi:hypothetical protein
MYKDDKCLSPSVNFNHARIMGMFSKAKRVQTPQNIQNISAKHLTLTEHIGDSLYTLVKGTQTGISHQRTSISTGQWLATLREANSPNCKGTFFFPDNACGPDVLFALKAIDNRNCKNLILCVVQVSSTI